jgi:hypothetical protein
MYGTAIPSTRRPEFCHYLLKRVRQFVVRPKLLKNLAALLSITPITPSATGNKFSCPIIPVIAV